MGHRGFITWGIQTGPFTACSADFVPKNFHLSTLYTGRSNFLLPQREEEGATRCPQSAGNSGRSAGGSVWRANSIMQGYHHHRRRRRQRLHQYVISRIGGQGASQRTRELSAGSGLTCKYRAPSRFEVTCLLSCSRHRAPLHATYYLHCDGEVQNRTFSFLSCGINSSF